MNPFDEFEFKPITDGLGFQNRTKKIATQGSVENSMQTIQPTLPRRPKSNLPPEIPTSTNKVDEILKTLNEKRNFDFTDSKDLKNYIEPELYKVSSFELSASLLDSMLVVATFLLSTIILLVITKVDLITNIYGPNADKSIYVAMTGLLMVLSWSYLVASRIFLGFTPGEWVFDQRVGRPDQFNSANYDLKIALRSLIVIATGFVLFPFLSLISSRDLLGKLLGVELMKKV